METDYSELLDTDHETLKKIVNGGQWMQIKGKNRDWKVYMKMVNTMKDGTLRDLANHPDFLALEGRTKESRVLQNLVKNRQQKYVDVLAAFKQTYVELEDIVLAQRVQNWAISMAKDLLRNETHPFAKTPEQKLVKLCQSHPLYWNRYSKFPSWTPGWKCTERGNPSSPVKLVSLDCEMAVVGEIWQVIRVCAVDRDCNTLIDELVLPDGKVEDFRTRIHGISENDLQGVTLTQAGAQELVMSIITPGTILVGQSLFHDLWALRIDHKRLIDVGFLFIDLRNLLSAVVNLPEISRVVLPDHNFRKKGETVPHDCLQDAIVPMKLVQYRLEHGAEHVRNLMLAGTKPPPPVADGFDTPLDSKFSRAKQPNRLIGVSIFCQCSSRAIQSLMLAQAEAEARGEPEIGTELLLLGLNITELGGPSEESIREAVDNLFPVSVELNFARPSSERVPFSPGSKHVLEATLQNMKKMGQEDIEPEHIVIALLLVDDGGASKVFDRLGVKKSQLRKTALQFLFQKPSSSKTQSS